jgi:hypothetical protein
MIPSKVALGTVFNIPSVARVSHRLSAVEGCIFRNSRMTVPLRNVVQFPPADNYFQKNEAIILRGGAFQSKSFSNSTSGEKAKATGMIATDVRSLQILKQIVGRILEKNVETEEVAEDAASSLQSLCTTLCESYLSISDTPQYWDSRRELIEFFALELGGPSTSLGDIAQAMRSYLREEEYLEENDNAKGSPDEESRARRTIRKESIIQERIRQNCAPDYEKVIKSILTQTSQRDASLGMQFVIQLRHDVLDFIASLRREDELRKETKGKSDESPDGKELLMFRLRCTDGDLRRMLSMWFSAGILGKM